MRLSYLSLVVEQQPLGTTLFLTVAPSPPAAEMTAAEMTIRSSKNEQRADCLPSPIYAELGKVVGIVESLCKMPLSSVKEATISIHSATFIVLLSLGQSN